MPDTTEEAYLELARDAKERFAKLKEENIELKKLLMICYTLFRISDEEENLCELGCSICSEFLDDYIFK